MKTRDRVWAYAAELSEPPHCPWQLEVFKLLLTRAEDGRALPESLISAPSFAAGLRGAVACAIGLAAWFVYIVSHVAGIGGDRLNRDAPRVLGLHAENSNRTRHVIDALASNDLPLAGIVVLGRARHTFKTTMRDHAPISKLPVVLPLSPRACFETLIDMPQHLSLGISVFSKASVRITLVDAVGASFRVMLGLTSARWWSRNGVGREVLLGHTGTADVMLLEQAMQRENARTVHLVHGQSIGPNFLAFSDIAVFRCRHDAYTYRKLGCYGRCTSQAANRLSPQRGGNGVLLCTNLAHPMNAKFRITGTADEEHVLREVAKCASLLGAQAFPLLWKPHPAILTLPTELQGKLSYTAQCLGFQQVPQGTCLQAVAAQSRWVVSTPSTVAIDLLQSGILTVIIDPQGTSLDSAIGAQTPVNCNDQDLAASLTELSCPECHAEAFKAAWEAIGPARALDLRDGAF